MSVRFNATTVGEVTEKLRKASENTPKVYNAGFSAGVQSGEESGYAEGFEEGKQSEYDAFWDAYQKNGTRTNYAYEFCGNGWTDETFKPKYDIIPKGSNGTRMFNGCGVKNLSEVLKKQKVKIDFSQLGTDANGNYYGTDFFCYQNYSLVHAPEIDFGESRNLGYLYYQSTNLVTIDKIIMPREEVPYTANMMLGECNKLENVVIAGTIRHNGLTLSKSKNLTRDSLMSIIDALADYSQDTSGTVWKVTLGATNLAKLTDSDKTRATKKGWSLL
jgi:hypothetical protein